MQSQVRLNRVPEKVPVWEDLVQQGSRLREALVQSQVKFNRVPEKVPEKVWEALVQSWVKLKRVPEKVPVKVWEALVQSQDRVPEKVPFNRVPKKVREALVQSQVRFNRVPKKAQVKVWEALVQSQVRFNRGLWCRARSGSTGFRKKFRRRSGRFCAEPGQVQQGSGEGLGGFGAEPGEVQQGSGEGFREGPVQQDVRPFKSGKPSWCVSSAWLRSTLQKDL